MKKDITKVKVKLHTPSGATVLVPDGEGSYVQYSTVAMTMDRRDRLRELVDAERQVGRDAIERAKEDGDPDPETTTTLSRDEEKQIIRLTFEQLGVCTELPDDDDRPDLATVFIERWESGAEPEVDLYQAAERAIEAAGKPSAS